jgi:hypothetical protein
MLLLRTEKQQYAAVPAMEDILRNDTCKLGDQCLSVLMSRFQILKILRDTDTEEAPHVFHY